MKVNSNTFILDSESFSDIENIIIRIAEDNNIKNVNKVHLKVTRTAGSLSFDHDPIVTKNWKRKLSDREYTFYYINETTGEENFIDCLVTNILVSHNPSSAGSKFESSKTMSDDVHYELLKDGITPIDPMHISEMGDSTQIEELKQSLIEEATDLERSAYQYAMDQGNKEQQETQSEITESLDNY